jgi:hypothetical protein
MAFSMRARTLLRSWEMETVVRKEEVRSEV